MSWNWQKEGRPFDKAADDFIKRCKLDDASITLLSGIPENVKDEVISSCRSDWEEGLSFDRIFIRLHRFRKLTIHVMELAEGREALRQSCR
mmetsp:Transcript_7205/g.17275  ORF Transcript_7205/g.17275 Transcript_7205/m.17275 type:complete len:91 (-) Transcript_7205:135-407(-)